MNEPANFGNGGLDGDGFGFSCEASNINYPPYKVWSIFLIIQLKIIESLNLRQTRFQLQNI